MESGNVEYNRAIYGIIYCSTYHISPYGLDTIQDFFVRVGHETTYASSGNQHFLHNIMSLSDLLKLLWTSSKIVQF